MKVGSRFFFFKTRNGRKERNLREEEVGRKGKRQREGEESQLLRRAPPMCQ